MVRCNDENPCSNCREIFDSNHCQICDDKCSYKHIKHGDVLIAGNYVHRCPDCGHRAHWLCSQVLCNDDPQTKMENTSVECTNCMSILSRSQQIREPIPIRGPGNTAFRHDTVQLLEQANIFNSSNTFMRVRSVEHLFDYFVSHKDEFQSQFSKKEKDALRERLHTFKHSWPSTNTPFYLEELKL